MAKSKKVAEPNARSEEYVVESSSESEVETSRNNDASKSKKRTSNPENSTSEEGSDSSSSSESDNAASSTSSSSDKPSVSKKRANATKPTKEPSNKKSKPNSTEPAVRTYPFNPPLGYKSLQLDASDYVSETGSMFANFDGKQVWHITAPASIPIASIESLDIPAALRGEPIFQHRGTSYNMFVGPAKGEALLIPKGADGKYSKANIEVSRSFHLRETQESGTKEPQLSAKLNGSSEDLVTDGISFVAHQQGERRPPREQPKGLLMRYQPYGNNLPRNKPYKLGNPTIEESEAEADSQNVLIVPASLSDEELVDRTRTPKKKKSKRSKEDVLNSGIDHSKEDTMDVDSENNATLSTPRSKMVTSASKPGSEKKRKKDRKEKA